VLPTYLKTTFVTLPERVVVAREQKPALHVVVATNADVGTEQAGGMTLEAGSG
jgi:hypothetical protein